MSKKRMKTRLGADGYDYPYTSEGLVFDSEGKSIDQKYATKKDLESLSIVDELEERVSANEESIAWLLENGGGGGGTISCYISTTDAENFIISTGNDLTLHLDFFSPNVGKGTLKVFINDVESKSITIAQGDTANIIEGDLFNTGSNTMRVYVVDRTGNLTNELTFYVRYGSTQITSTFDPYISYDYGSIIRYYFTVTALDTSDTLTFYIKIDDELQNPISCKSEVRAYFTFPSTLSVGSHYCEAWAEDSVGKSNILKFNIVILDDRAVVVASDTQTLSVEEGSQVSLDYKVYMKGNTTFITKIYIDNEYSSSGTCGLETSFYKTSDLKEGIHTIKLEVWDINETVSDYVTWTVTITPSTYEMVTATTAGSTAIFTAMNRLNSDENRETWIGTNQDGGQIVANLSNFAFNSESGWVDDNLIMSGNSAVEIPITPLANNAKYGFTLDIEFTSKAIGVEDALVLKLWDDTNNCGIKITTEELILRSKENNECRLYFTDNENTSVMFIIDRDEGFAKIYLNGVMCEAFHLNDYTVNGVAYLEDFTVNDTIKLGGSGYCQIKNLRVYEIALATNEILNNFISNETNKEAQRMLVEFQKGDNLPTLTIYGDFSGLGKDEKKPCDIVYMSTDVTKYGESFTLGGKKSSLQYQGTSSMAYPIKNYRINLCDSLGNKWKYNPFSGGQPESRFCLKADFITSNHAHNTGMAKFISDKLYNYDITDESTMNPAKWWSINNGGKLTDTRETINGFPCRLILVNDGDTALNEGQAEPTPGNTKDMGIFNFNNDKDNVASLGLDNEIFPNCLSYEVTANSDTSAGAFVPFSQEYNIEFIEKTDFFEAQPKNFLGVGTFYSEGIIPIMYGYDSTGSQTGTLNRYAQTNEITVASNVDSILIRFQDKSVTSFIIDGCKYNIVIVEKDSRECVVTKSGATELEYLQNSFELRYPDTDDYGEDYGYLGLSADLLSIDYVANYGNPLTVRMPIDFFGDTKTLKVQTNGAINIYEYDKDGNGSTTYTVKPGTFTFKDTTTHFAFTGTFESGYFMFNDVKYVIGEEVPHSIIQEPKVKKIFSQDYGLKRVIDWVGNATNEEFVADFDKYFDRHYTLRYYLLVVLIAGVDNLGKNMMLDTFDGQIWYPRFYDIDTILSYDNSGEIKFDVDIEMEQGYWNTSASRLWTKIRDNFHDELVEVYKQMRGNGVTYEQIMHYMYNEQIAKIPQTYYNKDFDIKYAPYADQYIGKAHGDGYEHMKRWLRRRFTFCDTLFDYAPSYENDVLTIRANTLEEMHLTIDTYTPLYQHVSFYNGNMEKIKITPGQPITFSGFAQTATDQEVLIYGGNNIKKITGISTCNPNSMLIGFAPRLTELDISNCPILTIVNSNKANFSPHTYLNKLNISNCPQLGGNLNVSNSPLLQEINARNSAITGLLLPTSLRNLKTLELPNTISSLALYDAGVLENLKFDEGVAMQSIELSNCPGITNTENFDLTQTPTVILDNSYDTEELYMSATTNLTLRNMKNMKRIIYTPNAEYSEFDINNIINGKNYKITTSSCPKLSTFMTTAPYRLSYNGDDVEYREEVIPQGGEIIGTEYVEDTYVINDTRWCGTIFIRNVTTGSVDVTGQPSTYKSTDYIEVTQNTECTITTVGGSYVGIVFFDEEKNIITEGSNGTHDNSSWNFTTISPSNAVYMVFFTTDGVGQENTVSYTRPLRNDLIIQVKDYGDITPNTSFTANTLDLSATQFSDIKFLCTTDVYNLKIPTTLKNFYCDSAMDIDTDIITDGSYEVIHDELIEEYTTNYEDEVKLLVEQDITLTSSEIGAKLITFRNNNGVFEITETTSGNRRTTASELTVFPGSSLVLTGEWIECACYGKNMENLRTIGWKSNTTITLDNDVYYIRPMFYTSTYQNATLTYKGIGEKKDEIKVNLTFTDEYWYTTSCKVSTAIPCTMGDKFVFTQSAPRSIGYRVYDGSGNKVQELGSNLSPVINNHEILITAENAKTVRFELQEPSKYLISCIKHTKHVLNVIPSSANGSLIFNMYSNSTTQPTSTSPYMWDLTGLKLNDFYTYGMNNWVKASDDSYVLTVKEDMLIKSDEYSNQVYWSQNPDSFGSCNVMSDYCLITPFNFEGKTITITNNEGSLMYIQACGSDITGTPKRSNVASLTIESAYYVGISILKTVKQVYIDYDGNRYVINIDNITRDFEVDGNTMKYMDVSFMRSKIINFKDCVGNLQLAEIKSISMPQRMPGYSVRLVNADITPNEYPTMLYPKLIDVTLPITGKLDYTKYNGSSLAWAYAYTTDDVSINPLGSQEQEQITNDYNKLYGTDFIDIVDVWVYKDTDTSKLSNNENITKAYIELTNANYKTRINDILGHYPNCTNLYFFDDGSVTTLYAMFDGNNATYKAQIEKIVFIEGYFNNLTNFNNMFSGLNTSTNGVDYDLRGLANASKNTTSLAGMFQYNKINSINFDGWDGSNIKDISNMFQYTAISIVDLSALDLSNVENMSGAFRYTNQNLKEIKINSDFSKVTNLNDCFHNCYALNQEFDFSKATSLIATGLQNTFYNCQALTTPPILPSNYNGNMYNTFYGCTLLTEAPIIPNGVTGLNSCFQNCKALTTIPNLPDSVTAMPDTFNGCSALTTLPNNIPSKCTSFHQTFQGCAKLVTAPSNGWKGNMNRTFVDCTSFNCQINIENATHLTATFSACSSLTITPIISSATNCSMGDCFKNCTALTTAPTIPQGVISVVECFRGCTSLTTPPILPNDIQDIRGFVRQCSSLKEVTIPLSNTTMYTDAITDCHGLENVTWVGERTSDLVVYGGTSYALGSSQGGVVLLGEEDIKELVPEHLADVKSLGTTATLTLGEIYGAYLTPDEVFTANAKGWTIVGASSDFTIVNASVDASTLTTDESVLSCFMELTSANYKTRIDEVLAHYPNCTDLYLFDDGSVTSLREMVTTVGATNNQTYKGQIQKVVFVDGYFENLWEMYRVLNTLPNLVEIDLNGIKGKVSSFDYAFIQCINLETIRMDKLDLSKVNNVTHMFYDCAKFNGLVDFSNSPLSMYALANTFRGCKALTITPKLPSDISEDGKMQGTFYSCNSLTEPPIIPSNVIDMSNCFYDCKVLTTAPEIPSGVTNMNNSFAYCTALTTVPIVPSVCTNLSYCFRDCKGLTSIDTTNWDTSNVTALDGLFYGCSNLTEIKGIENWNTSKVTGVWDLFFGCGSIEYINLSKWDMSKMSSTGAMYRNCASLKVAYLPIQDGIPNNALTGCRADLDVVWVGERKTDFNLGTYNHTNGFRQEDIQELVPEHLDDLHKDEIKISFSKKEITINNTKTTWEEE